MSGYAKVMMGGSGIPAGMATAINGGVQTLVAAGTTQGTATTINLGCAFFSTVAASSGGVLSAGAPGDDVWVYNAGANALAVYPPSGAKINNVATNGSVSLATNTSIIFKCVSATQWIANLSA
jgi:hypothetical protein